MSRQARLLEPVYGFSPSVAAMSKSSALEWELETRRSTKDSGSSDLVMRKTCGDEVGSDIFPVLLLIAWL